MNESGEMRKGFGMGNVESTWGEICHVSEICYTRKQQRGSLGVLHSQFYNDLLLFEIKLRLKM